LFKIFIFPGSAHESSRRSPAVVPAPSFRSGSAQKFSGPGVRRSQVDLPAFGTLKSLVSYKAFNPKRLRRYHNLSKRTPRKSLAILPFPARPPATRKRMGFRRGSSKEMRRVPPPLSSLPLPMKEYFPSKGDLAPLRHSFPPPERMEELNSPLLVSPSLPDPLVLDPDMSMKDRWESLVSPEGKIDTFAVNLATQGLIFSWWYEPPMSSRDYPPRSVVTSPSNTATLLPLARQWVTRGIVTDDLSVIPETVHFSRLFFVPKKGGDIRPILDLSFLNTFIKTPKLKMESISSILPFLSQGMWATSLDVTDAFWSVSIGPEFQKYLCFVLDGIVFMFLKLPFGLTSAPWAFSRLMRPIKKHLRSLKVHVSAFLDDFMIAALYRDLCHVHTSWAADLLAWLGFSINEEKSERVPKQSIVYLGVLINLHSLTIALPPEQAANISAQCNKLMSSISITRRMLESFVGLINFAGPMLQFGKLFILPVIIWMNTFTSVIQRDELFQVTKALRKVLRPFSDPHFLGRPSSFRTPGSSLDLLTDASNTGWSGVIGRHRVQDTWLGADLSAHINVREMLGILYSLYFFREVLADRTIQIYTDSLVALFCLRRMGSLHSPPLDEVTRAVVLFCRDWNISFIPYHIPGNRNILADQGSRMEPLGTEWMLDPDIFESLINRITPFPQVDLFATRVTARLPCYISAGIDPEAFSENALALSLNWNQFQSIYAFPPPAMLPDIIGRISNFRGSMLLIAPFALTSVWISQLFNRAQHWERLPTSEPLFQFVGGEVVYKSAEESPPLYVFFLYPR